MEKYVMTCHTYVTTNCIYFDSTFMFIIHIINVNGFVFFLKISTLITATLLMIFIFYSYLAIYYIKIKGTMCIIRGYLCHDIKQAMSYHIMKFYVTTCRISLYFQPLSGNAYETIQESGVIKLP